MTAKPTDRSLADNHARPFAGPPIPAFVGHATCRTCGATFASCRGKRKHERLSHGGERLDNHGRFRRVAVEEADA